MIPLFAPVRSTDGLLGQIQERVGRILTTGEYILGPEVDGFEKELARKTGFAHAIGCSNGTDALTMSLRALELPPDSEVITPAFSFVASTSPIVWAGLRPVFADVSVDTANVTVQSVERAITSKTRAVIAVDLFGRQAPIAELRQLCDAKGLYLIEDGAQSIGVPVAGKGPYFFTTSFYPTKNLGGAGDGGAVLTNDVELATRVREISRHGGLLRDHYVRVGTTGRLDGIQAAVLNVKLPHLDKWNTMRRSLASWYTQAFRPYVQRGQMALFSEVREPASHVWALYTIRLLGNRRGPVAEALRNEGIGCAPYYPKAIPDQPAMKGLARGSYPAAEQLASEVLSLPFFPELTNKELETVVAKVGAVLDKEWASRRPERKTSNELGL